jgi:hypothetical protein
MNPEHTSAELTLIDPKINSSSGLQISKSQLRPSTQRLWKALSFEHDEAPEKVPEKNVISQHCKFINTESNPEPERRTAPSNNSETRSKHLKSSKDTKGRSATLEAQRKSEQIKEDRSKLSKYLNRSSDKSVPPSTRDKPFSQDFSHQPRLPFHMSQHYDNTGSIDTLRSAFSRQGPSIPASSPLSIQSAYTISPYEFSSIRQVPEPGILERSLTLKCLQQSFMESQIDKTIEDVDVLCVNCYECIPVDQVDTHSNYCCKPVAVVPEPEDDVDLRIRKLMTAMQERQGSYTGDRVIMILQLQEIAHSVLENSLSLDTILHKLEKITQNSIFMSDGYSLTVFARRLAVLTESKSHDLPSETLKSADSLLRQYEVEVARQRQELEKWKLRNELLSQLAASTAPKGFRDIDSDVDGECDKSSVISGSSGLSEVMSDVGDVETANQMLQEISEEELEKYFYSRFLRKKYALPRHHKAREISIKEAYEKCIEMRIGVSQWDKYIDNLLSRYS